MRFSIWASAWLTRSRKLGKYARPVARRTSASMIRPWLEVLESKLAPAGFSNTTLALKNLTNLDPGQYSVWVSGFSTPAGLVLDATGHFVPQSGQIAAINATSGFNITLDRQMAGGLLIIYVTPAGIQPATLPFGVQPAVPPFANGQDNIPYPNDILEFTTDADGTLHIDVSQVTQFGMPLNLAAYQGTNKLAEVGVALPPSGQRGIINRLSIGDAYVAFMNQEANGSGYLPLRIFESSKRISDQYFTILNPNKYLTNPLHPPGSLDHYWDATIASLFTPGAVHLSLQGIPDGSFASEVFDGSAEVSTVTGNPALKLVGQTTGRVYWIFDPRHPEFSSSETATEMVFGNDGVFNDTNANAVNGGSVANALFLQQQVVAALNRGVALTAPYTANSGSTSQFWGTETNWYQSGTYNVYAKFFHQGKINGQLIFVNGQAYGFGYDESPIPVPPAPSGQPPVPSKFDPVPAGTNNVVLTAGPWVPGAAALVNGKLIVSGTSGDDVIRVRDAAHGLVSVLVNGQNLGNFAARSVSILGFAGNDYLDAGQLSRPVVLSGGAGRDTLIAGRGQAELNGGSGHDVLLGRRGQRFIGDGQDFVSTFGTLISLLNHTTF